MRDQFARAIVVSPGRACADLVHSVFLRVMAASSLTLHVAVVLFCATFVRSALGFGEALIAVPLLAFLIVRTLPSKENASIGDAAMLL